MLYSATHHIYSPVDGHSCGETRTFGSLKAARLWAKEILPESHQVSDEDYHRGMGKCSTVEIKGRYKSDKGTPVYMKRSDREFFPHYRTTVYPRIDIVPSVGQLGYW